ncbi:MAG TPA: hypothetical protein VHJ20_18465 [Polyangia bacterium]|nr:hypothetical protein [Polyangia bacterium]
MRVSRVSVAALAAAVALAPRAASALDKQGSAHGGATDVDPDGFDMSGAFSLGLSLYNPSYAARPDNTGHTLMRYAGHADIDVIGQHLSIPLDVNMFSDRDRGGAAKLAPSEFDVIGGVTTTWAAGAGALEAGLRFESDSPVDRPGASQHYVDARARYLYSFAKVFPDLGPALRDGDVLGWLTLGWFAYNPSYFARPNNTGRALFRYGIHTELSTFADVLSFCLDATMFTDRQASNPIGPSELDLTPELVYHRAPVEVHLALEMDNPVDRDGLSQKFLYALFVWAFDLVTDEPSALEHRSGIPSP